MKEISHTEVIASLKEEHISFFYFYTPLCGTCKLAKKMLDVVSTLIPDMKIVTCNINHMPGLAHQLKIKSVPAFLITKRGIILREVYAFQSVDYLYQLVKKVIEKHPLDKQ